MRKREKKQRRTKQRKGEEDQSQASGVGAMGAQGQEPGPPGGDCPPTLMLTTHKAAPRWGLWGEECLKGWENALHSGAQVLPFPRGTREHTYTCTSQTHTHINTHTHTQTLIHTRKQTNATIPRYTDSHKEYKHTDTHML